MPGFQFGLGFGPTANMGGGQPWIAAGGNALRVGGQILRINSKPLVVKSNG